MPDAGLSTIFFGKSKRVGECPYPFINAVIAATHSFWHSIKELCPQGASLLTTALVHREAI